MMFENVTNIVFTYTCNLDVNPTQLLNEAFMFCSIPFHQHLFIMFFNIGQVNCIIFDKTKSAFKEMSHGHVTFSQILCLCNSN